jgi:glycerol-3-phosphate acyltransferase PlsY
MNAARVLWVIGAYMAGTLPSALIVARAGGASQLIASVRRGAGEADPHILLWKQMGVKWMAVASTLDVLKGFFYTLAARQVGHLPTGWMAAVGAAVVLGHTYPPFAREMAGRGLAAAAGVFLVLLPVEMTVSGLLIVLGGVVRATGLSTTVGMGSVPVVALAQRQPAQLLVMGAVIFIIIVIRRVEGVGAVIRSGISPGRALLYRAVFDSSERPKPLGRHREVEGGVTGPLAGPEGPEGPSRAQGFSSDADPRRFPKDGRPER